MSTLLAKRSLCEDPRDYEGLLATLSVAKSLLDCDENGKVATGAAMEILEKYFNHGSDIILGPSGEPSFLLWFSPDGKDVDDESLTVTGNLELEFDQSLQPEITFSSNGNTRESISCFTNLPIYYYGKECSLSSTSWKPKYNTCIMEAVEIVLNRLDSYARDTDSITDYVTDKQYDISVESDPNSPEFGKITGYSAGTGINQHYKLVNAAGDVDGDLLIENVTDMVTDFSFKKIAELFSLYLGQAETNMTGINEQNIFRFDLDDLLKVISAFCDIVMQKVQAKRLMRKIAITVGECDL